MFSHKLQTIQNRVANLITSYLPTAHDPLSHALNYVCLNGGKRLRPFLVYATGEIYNTPNEILDPLAIAVELIHCYSLVHDDLPCMDDDALRRGKPTCHVKFDEATAVLVGDALQSLAFELLSSDQFKVSDNQKLKIIRYLARAIGPEGMVYGQTLDIHSTNKFIDKQTIFELHQAKTGALIQACVQCSAIACGETKESKINQLSKFGQSIGLAFQIQDDLLDATSNTEVLGKNSGMDQQKQKNTFVSIFGIEKTKAFAKQYYNQAMSALDSFSGTSQSLHQVAEFIIKRVA